MLLLSSAFQAVAQSPLFSGKTLYVLQKATSDPKLNLKIEYVRVIDEASYEIGIVNNDEQPVSVIGTIVFYDFTGTAFFVNGGLDEHGELAWQSPPGRSSKHVTRCIRESESRRDFDHGSYRCLKASSRDLAEATIVVVVITDMYVDLADRD